MNVSGRDVARYPYPWKTGLSTPSVMAREVCDPVCPPIEIAYTTFLKHGQCTLNVGTLGFVSITIQICCCLFGVKLW